MKNKYVVTVLIVSLSIFLLTCVTTPEAEIVPTPEPTPSPEPTPEPEVSSETQPEEEVFEVTEELYNQTLEAIEQVIDELNTIIRRGDFNKWKTFLTQDYIRVTTAPEKLKAISESPILQKNQIVLKDLNDYFKYVVVPSRFQVRLDKIEMLDESHVKAIMMFEGEPTILYRLVQEEGEWKIGIW